MFVSIAVITLGLILWICFMFQITAPLNCSLPDEFWSRTDSPLPTVLALFSTPFFLLFILNAVIYYIDEQEELLVTSIALIANAVLITTIGLILINLVVSNNNYRLAYQSKINVSKTSKSRCLQLEPFFGNGKLLRIQKLTQISIITFCLVEIR